MNATVIVLSGIFAAVFGGIVATGYFLVLRRREGDSTSTAENLFGLMQRLGQSVAGKKKERKPMRDALIAAGYRDPAAAYTFRGIQISAGILLAFVSAWLLALWVQDWSGILAGLVVGGVIGYLLPEWVLAALIRRRNDQIRAALPNALDIIALGTEAGQPLDQAIYASARELRRVFPAYNVEILNFQAELRAGRSRVEALQSLYLRTREPEMKKVCKLMIDGDRFGSGLAPALRNHGRYMRLRSRQKAQEAARKVSVKLVFPVFFLIFPSVILITLGPAIIQIQQLFQGLMK